MQNFTRYQIIYFRSIITVVYSHNNLEKLSEKNKKYCCNEFDGYGNFIVLNIFLLNKCDSKCTYTGLQRISWTIRISDYFCKNE